MLSGRTRSFHTSLPVVGILGGIGSGKSSVVRGVTDLHLAVIDADEIGHRVLQTDSVREKLHAAFGQQVFNNDGQVDRKKLAECVFAQSEGQAASKARLEQIVHPEIHKEAISRIQSVSANVDAIVMDAALLLEAGWADLCDVLIFIDTPLSMRKSRVMANRGWPSGELERREKTQWSVEQKRSHADFVIDNSGKLSKAATELTAVLRKIIRTHQPFSVPE